MLLCPLLVNTVPGRTLGSMTIEDTVLVAEAHVRVARGDLKDIRRRTGLSQEAIGRAVGVTRPTVLRWENGERRPSGQAAVRLAQLLRELDVVLTARRSRGSAAERKEVNPSSAATT